MIRRLHPYLKPRQWRLLLIALVLCTAFPCLSRGAAEPVWATVQAMMPIKPGHKDAARHDAIEVALQKATEKVMAAKISADALLVQLKLTGHIMGAIPYARIVEQQIISEQVQPCDAYATDASGLCYSVQLKVAVVEESEGMDPSFQITAALNHRFYKDGDAMQIQLLATADCFGYIFVLMDDGQVMRLLPNRYCVQHRVKANEPFVFPSAGDAAKGVRLMAHGLDDRPATQEAFFCLALKEPLENRALVTIQEGLYQLYGQRDSFMRELIRQVVRIPLDKRAEFMMPYQIVRAKGSRKTAKRRKR